MKIFNYTLYAKRYTLRKGFTLIETLVAIAIFGIFFAAVAVILRQILDNVAMSRVRAVALALAQEKMELVRNLAYTQVGTVGGIPQGQQAQTETVTINSLPFTVTTSIVYVDDPSDGIIPADTINTDYKRVRIEITWGGTYPSRQPVVLITNVVSKKAETVTSGGTVLIKVLDANGQPIANADVVIDNTVVTPAIHVQTLTDTNGIVMLPGSPPCITCYKIVVTKTGYSTDKTYSTQEVANPTQPLATVIDGKTTQISFAIDLVSTVTVKSYGSRESGFPPIGGVEFRLRGNKIIGYDTSDNPVYKYSYATNTGGSSVSIPGLEWDTYTLDFSQSSYTIAGSNPVVPFVLNPNVTITIPLTAVPKTTNSLLVVVQNPVQELLATVSAQLSSAGYEANKSTGLATNPDFGQAFFSGLNVNDYLLHLTITGYEEATVSVSIIGATKENVILNPL